MAPSERYVDHRRLDVGVAHRFHDGEGVGSRHGHLRSKRVAKPVNVNAGDAGAFARTVQTVTNIIQGSAIPSGEDQGTLRLPLFRPLLRHPEGLNGRVAERDGPRRVLGLRIP